MRARMPKLNREQLFAYELRFPSEAEQQDIVSYLNSMRNQVLEVKHMQDSSGAMLDELEQAILSQAFHREL